LSSGGTRRQAPVDIRHGIRTRQQKRASTHIFLVALACADAIVGYRRAQWRARKKAPAVAGASRAACPIIAIRT